MYFWKHKSGGYYCLSMTAPEIVAVDDLFRGLQVGDIKGDILTVCAVMPEDLWPVLPAAGEVRELGFHELWGMAKEQPSYDKNHWVNLQCMLGE